MIVNDIDLSNCNHCGGKTVLESMAGAPDPVSGETTVWFVMCKNDACAKRKDNGAMTVGRPLTNGHPSQAQAIVAWRSDPKRMRNPVPA